jgi:Phosphate-induced protein 1 conserved region
MMIRKSMTAVAVVCLAASSATTVNAQVVRGAEHNQSISTMSTRDQRPDGRGRGIADAHAPGRANTRGSRTSNGISYHGGPIITGGTNIYYIWYGNWASASQSILLNLASYIGGSPYFNINTTYTNSSGAHVSNSVHYNGSAADNYSQGKSFGDSGVQSIVNSAISTGKLPADSHGVYFVLTSTDVKETSGFCTSYCGWHTRATIAGADIKFAFVGNPDTQCPSACEEQTGVSPNGDPGADGMASVISHELEEAATDPDLNAWYDTRGQENADKCAWTFGTTKTAANGTLYNMTLGSRQYLIQRNWVNASGGYCSLSY